MDLTGKEIISVGCNVPDLKVDWRDHAKGLQEHLEAHLKSESLKPIETPDLPRAGCECEAHGLFRWLCQFNPFPIIGQDDSGEAIIGDPCWQIRVDTVVPRSVYGVDPSSPLAVGAGQTGQTLTVTASAPKVKPEGPAR